MYGIRDFLLSCNLDIVPDTGHVRITACLKGNDSSFGDKEVFPA
jgi:hypothetical protein